jgi:2-(1,2-epoxy-1,2-dihydrophenyl)acetyl-CoA isomerase
MVAAGDGLIVELADAVGSIVLDRPDRLNALTPDMLAGIPRALSSLAGRGARAILISGRGRGFCAGAELGARGPGPADLGERVETLYNPLARALADCPVPIVTAINGPAAGAGASIALAGDIVVAARSSYILLAFAGIGLVPDAGATWLIARSAGRLKTLEMALLAERMSAADALQAGLVTRVVEDDALAAEARAIAAKLAAGPTLAMGLIRRQVRAALDQGFDASLGLESDHQRQAGFSADYEEGVLAFKEKRKPVFTGR